MQDVRVQKILLNMVIQKGDEEPEDIKGYKLIDAVNCDII